ncbi:hypothetical protein D3C78_1682130 [compost metagenome]
MVSIDLFIVPAAVTALAIDNRLWIEIRLMYTDGVQHRMASGKVFLWQITAVRTRVSDQLVGFIQPLANVQHLLGTEVKAFRRLNLQRGKGKRQRSGI